MKRVAVFYSVGPHFARTLEAARLLGGSVTAIVPPHLDRATIVSLADDIVVTERAHFGPMDLGANRRLLKSLREAHYDAFVVLFDSVQLRILASLSGAASAWYCAPHGRLNRLEGGAVMIMLGETARRIRGCALYAWLWVAVRVTRVKTSTARKEAPRR